MIRPKPHLKEIYRSPALIESRIDCFRLDKNEYLPGWPDIQYDNFIKKIRPEHLSIHPETGLLLEKLERVLKISKHNMVISAGSDGAIKAAFEVFVDPGDEVIIPSPTFAMYYVYARIFNAKLIEIHYDNNLSLNMENFLDSINSRTKLIAIANPNSPTGTVLFWENLQKIVTKASSVGAAVLIDEAYYPFYEKSVIEKTCEADNLIVTRSFSKAAGVAGMRVGVLVSNREIAKLIFSVKPMYEITTISSMLAEYILDNYGRLFEYAEQVREGKEFLSDYFKTRGYDVLSGNANFLHVNFGNRKSEIVDHLGKRKVLFKAYFEHKSLMQYSRFTVGPVHYMKKFTSIFDEIN